jgi:hypothetical protein
MGAGNLFARQAGGRTRNKREGKGRQSKAYPDSRGDVVGVRSGWLRLCGHERQKSNRQRMLAAVNDARGMTRQLICRWRR